MKTKILTEFSVGLIIGFLVAVVIFVIISGIYFYRVKEKELIENAEKLFAIEELREDISGADYLELLDSVPGVRRAADNATAEFERKRDEALQRFRSQFID